MKGKGARERRGTRERSLREDCEEPVGRCGNVVMSTMAAQSLKPNNLSCPSLNEKFRVVVVVVVMYMHFQIYVLMTFVYR